MSGSSRHSGNGSETQTPDPNSYGTQLQSQGMYQQQHLRPEDIYIRDYTLPHSHSHPPSQSHSQPASRHDSYAGSHLNTPFEYDLQGIALPNQSYSPYQQLLSYSPSRYSAAGGSDSLSPRRHTPPGDPPTSCNASRHCPLTNEIVAGSARNSPKGSGGLPSVGDTPPGKGKERSVDVRERARLVRERRRRKSSGTGGGTIHGPEPAHDSKLVSGIFIRY